MASEESSGIKGQDVDYQGPEYIACGKNITRYGSSTEVEPG